MHKLQGILGSSLFVALSACSSSAPAGAAAGAGTGDGTAGSSTSTTDAANVDAGADAGDDALTVYCPDGSIDSSTLVSGVSAKGKSFTAKFVQATPSPPARYDNSWVFDFVDASGAAVSDMKMTKADTWMPYHGHGWPGHGTAMAQPGRFNVDINLNMRGYFRVDLDVSSTSQGSDHIEFFYCYQ